jgi:hypothetical protein
MSGDALLDRCLAARGGLDRWLQFGAIDVDLTTSGLVFATHVQPSLRTMARDRSSTCAPARSCHDSRKRRGKCCRPTRAPTSTRVIVASS